MSDIEIARAAKKIHIRDVAAKVNIPEENLIPYGHDAAKINFDFIEKSKSNPDGKLILVTAINPTPAGEGKTTTSVGLNDGLNKIGKKLFKKNPWVIIKNINETKIKHKSAKNQSKIYGNRGPEGVWADFRLQARLGRRLGGP